MLKALLRKQFLATVSGISMDRKRGNKRKLGAVIAYVALFVFLLLSVFMMFFGISDAICKPFVEAGLSWFYFAFMGLTALALGIIGSAFMSCSVLFEAKDNELLLSMPIKPSSILFSRMISIWLMGLVSVSLALAPALLRYCIVTEPSGTVILFGILLILLTSLLVLGLSCLLGWLVAIIMSHVGNRNIATVVLTVVFLGAYYSVYFRIQTILQNVVTNGSHIADILKSWAYPIYQFGLASLGDAKALAVYALICVVICVAVYCFVSVSFIKIVTANRGAVKKEYKPQTVKAESTSKALLRKELRHFAGSPAYMLNGGFGILIMPVAAVMFFIKREALAPLFEVINQVLPGDGGAAIAVLSIVCLATTMNVITGPSISIEGKTFWITKALPIDFKEFLMTKEKLHLILTCIPAAVLWASAAIVFKLQIAQAVVSLGAIYGFIQYSAALGLVLNLKMPKLDWLNETACVKSSLAGLICIFGGWVVAILPVISAYLIAQSSLEIELETLLIVWLFIFVIAARFLNGFVIKKGPDILQSL